jgi:hypothetical protein
MRPGKVYPGCEALDLDCGTLKLALDLARDGEPRRFARKLNDVYATIVVELRRRLPAGTVLDRSSLARYPWAQDALLFADEISAIAAGIGTSKPE